MSRQAIRAHAIHIEVPYLVHFTRVENLISILEHGLYPVGRFAEIGVAASINDHLRLDGHLDGTSVSIGFPNDRMFYKCRNDNPGVAWAVLVIHPSVLWLKDCAFCRYNAADARISAQALVTLKTESAFVGMYQEIEGHASRQQQRLKSYDPTDRQAEVLVFDVIEPNLIAGVSFDSEAVKAAYEAHLGDRIVNVYQPNRGFFASRTFVR